MKNLKSAKSRVILSLAVLLAALFGSYSFSSSRTIAAANSISWSQSINSVASVSLLSNDGAVFGGNCDLDSSQFVANEYSNTGSSVWSIPNTANPLPCSDYRTEAIDTNGAVYTIVSDPQSGINAIAKFFNGSLVWSITPPNSQGILALGLGSDGNIYGISDTTNNTGGTIGLFGVTPGMTEGATTPTIVLSKLLSYQAIEFVWFSPYVGGLAIEVGGVGVQYFSYSGVLQNTVGAGKSLTSLFTVSASGEAFLPVPMQSQACPIAVDSSIAAYDPNGALWTYPLPTCSAVQGVQSLPNGGVVALIVSNDGTSTGRYFLALSGSGGLSWKAYMPYASSGNTLDNPIFKVTTSGDLVYIQHYVQPDNNHGVVVDVLSGATGAFVYGYDFSPSPDTGGYAPSFNDIQTFAIAKGIMYLNLSSCMYSTNGGAVGCGGQTIFAMRDSVLTLDYPRGAILQPSQPPPSPNPHLRKYVGMGDSFSSGEGNPPFITGPGYNTDQDGCHRSVQAYPALLGRTAALHLQLSFVACSGATSSMVLGGMNGEQSQLNAIEPDTSLITITVGGDDLGFVSYITACYTPDELCDNQSSAYASVMSKMSYNLPGGLRTLFAAIKAKINSKAKVLVVGYPMILPGGIGKLLNCQWLTPGDVRAARQITALLDASVFSAVNEANSVLRNRQFVYVDPNTASSPFRGHELCTKNSYFKGLVLLPDYHYSFHPNALGQQAYYKLVRLYLG